MRAHIGRRVRLDSAAALHYMEVGVRILRKAGLRPPTAVPKRLVRRLIGEDVTVVADGLRFTGSTRLHRGYLWGLRRGDQEPFMAELFRQSVRDGMVVCDVGAFLGYYACIAAQQAGPRGHVYALEPDPRTFPYLRRNVVQNRFDGVIATLPVAASNAAKRITLNLHHYDPSQTSQWVEDPLGVRVEVGCAALEELTKARPPDVMKIDVGGNEPLVLAGMGDTVRPRTLFIEHNPAALQAAGYGEVELFAALQGTGYSVSVIDEPTKRVQPVSAPPRGVRWANLRCVLTEAAGG
jgi:FkbM family methyltransferase